MKKNGMIGIGLTVVSAVALAAAVPVFADVRPGYIETSGTVVTSDSVSSIDEQVVIAAEKDEQPVTDNGVDETSINCPDFEKSTNFCELKFDLKTVDQALPEANPSDYEDADIRALAAEYKDKGYFLTDCKEEATKHGSGTGAMMYVFCNGFTAVDDNTGNNTRYYEVVKATHDEFKWFIDSINDGSFKVSKDGSVETYSIEDSLQSTKYKYDSAKQILQIAVEFNSNDCKG